ncbi:MAG: IS5 family transposase [Bacteroidetes bacterium]|nr:MAG: IS5 family transposase [Bacteroidota bacterium]
MKKQKQKGMFDEEFRLEKLSKQSDPLEKLQMHIDFEFFRKPLEKCFNEDVDRSLGGRPAYDYVLMLKVLILQRYYNLSDDKTEYAILDRLSFMRFLGLTLSDGVPDAKTIWNFKNILTQKDMIRKLFEMLDKQLDKDGIILHEGKMVDASIVEVPRQRNTREENKKIKEGVLPKAWKNDPDKLRQKDVDAAWLKKNGEDYFGYKNHVKADTETKLITNYSVTSASVHDSQELEELIEKKEDKNQPLYADSAYRSEAIESMLERKKIESQVHEKGYRNQPLTKRQQQRNRKKSKTRARVEHIFGFMTNSMNNMFIHSRGLAKASTAIGLMNITYNLFRLVQLKIELSP